VHDWGDSSLPGVLPHLLEKRGKSLGPVFYFTLTVKTGFSRTTELSVGLIVGTLFMGTSQAGCMANPLFTFCAETASLVFVGRCSTRRMCMIQEVTGRHSPEPERK